MRENIAKQLLFTCIMSGKVKFTNYDIPNYYDFIDKLEEYADKITNKTPINKIYIYKCINNIQDLLDLVDKYPCNEFVSYNIDIKSLHNIKKPLLQLNNMVGMTKLKSDIVDQILYYMQNLHIHSFDKDINKDINKDNIENKCIVNKDANDYMHTVICGPPGTGKTEVAKIIGDIFSKLGILKKGIFKKVTRADLIAGYVGQTALKTKEVIKECLGGVLFIDEAYALGNDETKDIFSKECIDTLCEALSNYKDNLMVIIAGYDNELDECFFKYNRGLKSRFAWRFKIDDYSASDLYNIFCKKVKDSGWTLSSNITMEWFQTNKKYFKYYGRDMETLFAKTKITHGRRVFCLDNAVKKIITIEDLNQGLKQFIINLDLDKEDIKNQIIHSMYI